MIYFHSKKQNFDYVKTLKLNLKKIDNKITLI